MITTRMILGTMTFGWSKASSSVDINVARAFVDIFSRVGTEIDTALVYMDSPGISERMVADIVRDYPTLEIHTKAHPTLGVGGKLPNNGGGFSEANLRSQVEQSLANLNSQSLAVFYLHQPDVQTNLEETLRVCNDLFTEGRIKALGMSNYSAKEVREAVLLCSERSWLKPTIYQGNYNVLNRDVETDLLPTLSEFGISFFAYNPLAAGLLSGKYTNKSEVPATGRFGQNQTYQDRYWKDETFESLQKIRAACDAEGVTLLQAAFSWLACHSNLKAHDGVVLGASTTEQLEQNIEAWKSAKPLSAPIIDALNESWILCQPNAFSYFRGYSGAGGDASIGLTK